MNPMTSSTTETALSDNEIVALRARIDQLDADLIRLWSERAALSQQIGRARLASGGTRLALAREQEILGKFREALGPDGSQLAMLLLRAGRGTL